MKYFVPLVTALLGIANAQPPDAGCCNLKAAQTAEEPGTIKITIENNGNRPVLVILDAAIFSFTVTAKSADGSEPVRTSLGESLRRGNHIPFNLATPEHRQLQPGESVDQLLDLGLIWTLAEGRYMVGISRGVMVENRVVTLRTEIVVTIPHGYSTDKACMEEARAKIAARRRAGPLRGEEVPEKSNELEAALSRRIEILSHSTTHALTNAFMDTLQGAHIPGGMVLTNEGGTGAELVCVIRGESVRDTLEKIQAAGAALTLDGSAPIVNIIDVRASDFLETKIAKVVMPSPRYATNEALNAVFDAPEVVSRKAGLGLEEQGPLRPLLPGRNEWAERDGPTILENVTLRQALNQIVQRLGTGIWIYDEWKLGPDRRGFTLGFTYRSSDARK